MISRISQNETKRSLIHFIASIFDPLGLTIPVILNMKELYQDACKQKLKWDKILPVEFHKWWKRILLLFTKIKEIKNLLSVFVKDFSGPINAVELYCFSDASQRNYASVIYLFIISTSFINLESCCLYCYGQITIING